MPGVYPRCQSPRRSGHSPPPRPLSVRPWGASSLASGALISALNGPALRFGGRSKSMSMHPASLRNTGPMSDATATSARSTGQPWSQLTLFAEAFPASPTAWLADVPAPTTSATSGRTSPDSFASVDPDGSWRKTCQGYSQVTLDGSLERFSETWPRAGMTRSGTAYRLRPSAPLIVVIGSGLLPTPNAVETINPNKQYSSTTNASYPDGRKCQPTLSDVVTRGMWPTPTGRDHKAGTAQSCANVPPNGLLGRVVHQWATPTRVSGEHPGRIKRKPHQQDFLSAQVGGSLNPTWVEWLMGYPLGWTVCEGSATRSSRKSPNGSPAASATQMR